jgi:hypothetical protein
MALPNCRDIWSVLRVRSDHLHHTTVHPISRSSNDTINVNSTSSTTSAINSHPLQFNSSPPMASIVRQVAFRSALSIPVRPALLLSRSRALPISTRLAAFHSTPRPAAFLPPLPRMYSEHFGRCIQLILDRKDQWNRQRPCASDGQQAHCWKLSLEFRKVHTAIFSPNTLNV